MDFKAFGSNAGISIGNGDKVAGGRKQKLMNFGKPHN
jgi:hypothetical protein